MEEEREEEMCPEECLPINSHVGHFRVFQARENLAPVDRVVAARQSLQNANVSIPSYGVVPRPVVPAAVLCFPLLGEVKRT